MFATKALGCVMCLTMASVATAGTPNSSVKPVPASREVWVAPLPNGIVGGVSNPNGPSGNVSFERHMKGATTVTGSYDTGKGISVDVSVDTVPNGNVGGRIGFSKSF